MLAIYGHMAIYGITKFQCSQSHLLMLMFNMLGHIMTSDLTLQLENFVMLKWAEDETVIPRESRF